ncbi:MAG: alcohol dehydrogenase catalytic domain-containing protein [Halioglobus sp.]|nr:alcohol dehydrogenase catalytic domain-containing protein [Halioglobus sp.]
MKAAVFKAPGRPLVIEERPRPEPEAGEVLVRVKRTGICGSDLHMTSGRTQQLALDSVIGHEFCGEVVALGPGVKQLQLGDRVAPLPYIGCGHCPACLAGRPIGCPDMKPVVAGFCEYSRVGERDCVRLPPEVTDEAGALIEPLATGLQGVRKARLEVGASVLVTGAGAIGLATAFWAARLGAGNVAVMAGSNRRRPIAAAMGASHFIARSDTPDPAAAVQDALGGAPDVVFEAVGLPGAIAQAIDYVKPHGTVISMGFCDGADSIFPVVASWKEVELKFSLCYYRQDFQYTAHVLAAGDQRPLAMITDTISLEQLPDKFEGLREPGPDCKVMVDPS